MQIKRAASAEMTAPPRQPNRDTQRVKIRRAAKDKTRAARNLIPQFPMARGPSWRGGVGASERINWVDRLS
jgi:hypothetical protein